jgi:mono/diheme cytochrome c family protein
MSALRWLGVLTAIAWAAGASAQESGDPAAGLSFARSICAECHAVERGERTSPNPLSPSFEEIAAVPGMTGTALAVVLSNPHREMPDLILERDELSDVVAYILTLKPI